MELLNLKNACRELNQTVMNGLTEAQPSQEMTSIKVEKRRQ